MSKRSSRLAEAIVLGLLALNGCGNAAKTTSADYAGQLAARISTDALMAHLQRLQTIADAHGGTRQTGTPGYDASVDYVVKALQDKGFDVQTPEFDVGIFHVNAERLTVAGSPAAAGPSSSAALARQAGSRVHWSPPPRAGHWVACQPISMECRSTTRSCWSTEESALFPTRSRRPRRAAQSV